MLSGRRLDLLDPSPFDIEIEDIAHGLARVARWNGQTSGDYAFSVAEHSVVVEKLFSILNPKASREDKLVALLHDAAEYVVGDMISPFKAALGIDYTDLEHRIEQAVHLRFGLPPHPRIPLKKAIKTCDIYCAYFEAIQIAGFSEAEADKFFTKPPGDIRIKIKPLSVVAAKKLYLKRFAELA
ncbi:MAG: HD family hydrolase [Robiginitomaculum sp.]|nr:HD family hydrolase [Robiginitomaculum sp.]